MSEEEKKAIEELKEFIKGPCEICKFCKGAYKLNRKNVIHLLNLIEKLRERLKLMDDYNYWVHLAVIRGIELEKLQKENEQLKDQEATARKINELLVQRYSNSISKQKLKEQVLNPMKEAHDRAIKGFIKTDAPECSKYSTIAQELGYFIGKIENLIRGYRHQCRRPRKEVEE